MTARQPILDLPTSALEDWMVSHAWPKFHARQVLQWIYQHRASRFEEMSNLPKAIRAALAAEFSIYLLEVSRRQTSPDGTDKLLLQCTDGRRIEAVLMYEQERRTICISTQVGCGMGCVFCASGLKGVERNLTRGEILEQILRLRDLLPAQERLSNIVVMGMGESLANLENLIAALDQVCSPEGLGMSQRRVTISTVGLPEKILKLAALDRQYHLAVSLHAATDSVRDEIVPINRKIGVNEVLNAADAYFHQTGRQVTYEYVLLHDVNDHPSDAQALVARLRGKKSHVNLIPYNPVEGLPFSRPPDSAIGRFVSTLRTGGVSVTVRQTKGRAIDAACGQLRRRAETPDDSSSIPLCPAGA